jgi:hypothetical protein
MTNTMTLNEHGFQVVQVPYLEPSGQIIDGLDETFKSRTEARKNIEEKVWLYNNKRIHGSIDYMTPKMAYHHTGYIPKRW